MKLSQRMDDVIDALLREWGRWRRLEMTHAGAPRKHPQGSSWQSMVSKDKGAEINDPDYIDPEPDEQICLAMQRAYDRLKSLHTGYEVVIRDYYVDGRGWPPRPLLRHARYLMWSCGE